MGEEILHQLHVLRRHADDVAGAPAQQVGRRELVELVVERDPHLGEEPEGHVVGDPGFEPVQEAREGCCRVERDQQPADGGALLEPGHHQRAQHAHTDEGHHAGDAEDEGEVDAPAEGPHQAEQPHPGAPPAEAGGTQHFVVGVHRRRGGEVAVLGGGLERGLRARRGGRRRLQPLAHLVRHQAVIDSPLRHQLGLVPALHHAAFVQHEDAIRVDHAGEAVRHDEHRPPAHEARERVLDHGLVLRIDRGKRLVEQRIGASRRSARAMAMRWRWPPERRMPRSPITVS